MNALNTITTVTKKPGAGKQFVAIAVQTHAAFLAAKDCLANLSPDMEERFRARFSRYADPLSANALARELCEHHEWVQQSKSNDGKRAWFDRMTYELTQLKTVLKLY